MRNTFYKAFNKEGYDFHTGRTINYGASVGKTVRVPGDDFSLPPKLCDRSVIHASRKPEHLLKYITSYPFRIATIEGKPVIEEKDDKAGFKEMKVKKEIPQEELDALFGVKWEFMTKASFDPRKPETGYREVGKQEVALLVEYAGLRDLWDLRDLRDLRGLWDLRDLRDLRGLWDLWDLRGLWDLRDLRGLRGLRGLWDLWGLELSYLVSIVLTERERWLVKHTYLIEPCEALMELARRGFIPTYEYDAAKTWKLWSFKDGKWVEVWKGSVDSAARTAELDKAYRKAIA